MFVKPAPGALVRDPVNPASPLPPEGREVPDTAYFRRLIRAGDLVVAEPTMKTEG